MLNERERWLIIEGFIAGYNASNEPAPISARISDIAKAWLEDIVADGVTVEMVLVKEGDERLPKLLR